MRILKGIAIGVFIAGTLGVLAGTGTLSSVSGGRVQTSHVNQFYSAFNQDLVPRNSSGVATSLGGSLGTSTYKWLKNFVESGYWKAGDIKMHHSFNGTVKCGQGWMVANGSVINEANYDADTAAGHTAGDWDIYVVSSSLDGKYSPNFTARYPIGVAATTQDGSIAITETGNASSQINLAHDHTHTHTGPSHSHAWYESRAGANDRSYDVSANFTDITSVAAKSFNHILVSSSALDLPLSPSTGAVLYTGLGGTGSTGSNTSSSQLSSTQSIKPASIEVQYCIRVVD